MIHNDIRKLGRFSQAGHRITGDPQKGSLGGDGGLDELGLTIVLGGLVDVKRGFRSGCSVWNMSDVPIGGPISHVFVSDDR